MLFRSEMADVQAQIECNAAVLMTPDERFQFRARVIVKVRQMQEWEVLVAADTPYARS